MLGEGLDRERRAAAKEYSSRVREILQIPMVSNG